MYAYSTSVCVVSCSSCVPACVCVSFLSFVWLRFVLEPATVKPFQVLTRPPPRAPGQLRMNTHPQTHPSLSFFTLICSAMSLLFRFVSLCVGDRPIAHRPEPMNEEKKRQQREHNTTNNTHQAQIRKATTRREREL